MLLALSSAVLIAGGVLSGIALKAISPQMPFTLASLPLGRLVENARRIYLGAWLIVAIHTWIADRWPSFNLAIGAGILATVPNIMIMQSAKWAPRSPWAMPFVASQGFLHPDTYTGLTVLLGGAPGGLLVALITGWEFLRRDVL